MYFSEFFNLWCCVVNEFLELEYENEGGKCVCYLRNFLFLVIFIVIKFVKFGIKSFSIKEDKLYYVNFCIVGMEKVQEIRGINFCEGVNCGCFLEIL